MATKQHTCEICGKPVTKGYVFDGMEIFCTKKCAVKFFNNDRGCVNILLDETTRLEWKANLDEEDND